MIWELLLKTFILFRGFLKMKTTFSYFPGMFENPALAKIIKKNLKYYEISTIYLFGIKLIFYDPSWMLQLPEFVWTLRSSVWAVFNNFLLIDATYRSKFSSNQKHFFIPTFTFREQSLHNIQSCLLSFQVLKIFVF